MKISFDARYAEEDFVGIGKYIYSLVTGLAARNIKCILFYSRKPKVAINGKNIRSVILKSSNRYYFEQVLVPLAIIKNNADLYHALGNVGVPLFCPVPSILTLHDLIPLEFKNYFSYSLSPFLSSFSYNIRLRSSIFKSTKIVTVSNFIKNELIKKLGVNRKIIQTIYSGAPSVNKGRTLAELPDMLKNQRYILNNGGIDIRKNLDKLIEAFYIVRKKNPDLKLVITGNNKRLENELAVLIKKLNITDSVIFTGYVNENVLCAIIKSAALICYPTLSEGFGFPVLEGFGMGIPVVSSNTSSIPEISHGAALLVDPKNENHIADAMNCVINDRTLAEKMVLDGKHVYNMFNWKKTVNEYLDLYHNF